MTTTTSSKTIAVLKTIFGEYGVPHQLMTDQGPQFMSQEFRDYCQQLSDQGQALFAEISSEQWLHQSHGQDSQEHHD